MKILKGPIQLLNVPSLLCPWLFLQFPHCWTLSYHVALGGVVSSAWNTFLSDSMLCLCLIAMAMPFTRFMPPSDLPWSLTSLHLPRSNTHRCHPIVNCVIRHWMSTFWRIFSVPQLHPGTGLGLYQLCKYLWVEQTNEWVQAWSGEVGSNVLFSLGHAFLKTFMIHHTCSAQSKPKDVVFKRGSDSSEASTKPSHSGRHLRFVIPRAMEPSVLIGSCILALPLCTRHN